MGGERADPQSRSAEVRSELNQGHQSPAIGSAKANKRAKR